MDENRTIGHSTPAQDHPMGDAPVVPGRMWSTMLDGFATRNTPLSPKDELGERIRAAAFAWKEGIASEVPIWTPKHEYRDVSRGLSWGYTVLDDGNGISAFQLVVYVTSEGRHAGHDEHGAYHMVSAMRVSAWSGPLMAAS